MTSGTFEIFTKLVLLFDIAGAIAAIMLFLASITGAFNIVTSENCEKLLAKLRGSLPLFFAMAALGLTVQAYRQYITIKTGFSPRDDEFIGWVLKDISLNYLMLVIIIFWLGAKAAQLREKGR